MSKLSKAEEFYLRGHNGKYIKKRTGISIQSLLKQLKSKGVVYDKNDIIRYQVEYIRARYSVDDIKNAYREISEKYENLEHASHCKKIVCLGCGFGNHAKVFRKLLGDDEFNALRNECWKKKQVATVQFRYGVDNVFDKKTFDQFVSADSVFKAREKRTNTMLERYGVAEPLMDESLAKQAIDKMHATCLEKYGTENPMQLQEVSSRSVAGRQATMIERYGSANSAQVDSIRDKMWESRKRNGHLSSSLPEETLYEMLVEKFGEEDVFRNVLVDDRYPWHVDFYIKSRDLFIELNGDKCHGNHWFDCKSEHDCQVRDAWMDNYIKSGGKKRRYKKYVDTWCYTDTKKRNAAAAANLNYLVFWDGSSHKAKKHMVANLKDANEWFSSGCPDSCDWCSKNTY